MDKSHNNSLRNNKKFHFVVRGIPALAFTLFTLYQILLVFFIHTNRVNRVIGIIFYIFITLSAYFVFSNKKELWNIRSVLLVSGLSAMFLFRLPNLPVIIENLSSGEFSEVIYFGVYICTQLGTIGVIAAYLVRKSTRILRTPRRKITAIISYITIALFTVTLLLECVLIVRYHELIDITPRLTLFNRFMFYLGYAGTALSFTLQSLVYKDKEKHGKFVYSEKTKSDVDMVI